MAPGPYRRKARRHDIWEESTNMSFNFKTAAVVAVAAFGAMAAPAAAEYPEKPIRLIIPFGPGGATDTVGRMIAGPLEEALGVSVAAINQPGAGGAVGLANLAGARADGYTIAIGSDSSIAARPLMTESGYSSDNFKPIARLVRAPIGFAVRADSPYETLGDLVAAMEERDVLWSSPGVGSGPFLAAETFFKQAGTDEPHVNASSGGDALVKLLSGEVDFVSSSGSNFPAMLDENEGVIRVLAVASEDRWPVLPDAPTFNEQGVEFTRSIWFGLVAPKEAPQEAIDRLAEEVAAILESEDAADVLRNFNFSNGYQSPEEFAAEIESTVIALEPVLEAIGMAK